MFCFRCSRRSNLWSSRPSIATHMTSASECAKLASQLTSTHFGSSLHRNLVWKRSCSCSGRDAPMLMRLKFMRIADLISRTSILRPSGTVLLLSQAGRCPCRWPKLPIQASQIEWSSKIWSHLEGTLHAFQSPQLTGSESFLPVENDMRKRNTIMKFFSIISSVVSGLGYLASILAGTRMAVYSWAASYTSLVESMRDDDRHQKQSRCSTSHSRRGKTRTTIGRLFEFRASKQSRGIR